MNCKKNILAERNNKRYRLTYKKVKYKITMKEKYARI